MLRGFRWQFVALVVAAILFPAALLSRQDNTPAEVTVTPPPLPSATAALPPTITPNPGVIIPPETSDISEFHEGLVGQVQRLNPLLADLNAAERDLTSLIFEGLTRIDIYGEPVPDLAKNWVVSSDYLEYVVTLRDDVLWQDGLPFTADDVLFTMQSLSAPDFPGSPALGAFWQTVETEKLGPHLVRFRLTQPLSSFPAKLRIGILPAHALQGTPAAQLASHPFNLSPIGTGPYQLEALRSGGGGIQQIDLRVAPVYRQRPEGQAGYAIDRLSFMVYPTFGDAVSALSAGDLDGLATTNQRQALLNTINPAQFEIHSALDASVGMLIFNWQRDETPYFREQRVRVALASGLDRASVVERWLRSRAVPANSPLWPGNWAYESDLTWPSSDLTTARFLLDTANLGNASSDEDATESPYLLSFSILMPDDPALVSLGQDIAAQWSQLNLDITVESVDQETYQSRLDSGDFDAALVELSLGGSADPDLYGFWHQGQYPDGENYGGVDDSDISELLERARRDPSGINRKELYEQFQKDFVERAIAIPLYYPLFTYVTTAQVKGVQLGFIAAPADRFLTLQDWSITP